MKYKCIKSNGIWYTKDKIYNIKSGKGNRMARISYYDGYDYEENLNSWCLKNHFILIPELKSSKQIKML